MRVCYLDQKDWINLGKAHHRRPGGAAYEDVLEVLRTGVEAQTVVLPLSMAHYLETHHRAEFESRLRLAHTMLWLSCFWTIAPPHRLIPWQVEMAVSKTFATPAPISSPSVMGIGAGHVFDSLGPAPSISSIGDRWLYEMIALAGVPLDSALFGPTAPLPNDGGVMFRDREQRLAAQIDEFELRHRLGDVIGATELVAFMPDLIKALSDAGLTFDAFLALGANGMNEFVRAVSLADCAAGYRHYHHQNRTIRWEPNDLADVNALSVATAFCDIVVTEKQWCDAAHRARLDERYGTTFVSDVRDVVNLIA